MIRTRTYVEDARLTGPPKDPASAQFAVLKSEITLATARNAQREDRHQVKPDDHLCGYQDETGTNGCSRRADLQWRRDSY